MTRDITQAEVDLAAEMVRFDATFGPAIASPSRNSDVISAAAARPLTLTASNLQMARSAMEVTTTPSVGGWPLQAAMSREEYERWSRQYGGGWGSYVTTNTTSTVYTKLVDLLECLQLLKSDEIAQIHIEVIGEATIVHVIVFNELGNEQVLKFSTKDKHAPTVAAFKSILEALRKMPPVAPLPAAPA